MQQHWRRWMIVSWILRVQVLSSWHSVFAPGTPRNPWQLSETLMRNCPLSTNQRLATRASPKKGPAPAHLVTVQRVLRRPGGDGNRIGLAAAVSLAVQILSIPGDTKMQIPDTAGPAPQDWWRVSIGQWTQNRCVQRSGNRSVWLRLILTLMTADHSSVRTGFGLDPGLCVYHLPLHLVLPVIKYSRNGQCHLRDEKLTRVDATQLVRGHRHYSHMHTD